MAPPMTTESKGKQPYKKHPIQLVWVKVIELSIKADTSVDQRTAPDAHSFSLSIGHTEYDEENKQVATRVSASIKAEEDKSPFDLRVELMGSFEVDDSQFPAHFVNDWAGKNAALVLYPYLREHVYSLTSRSEHGGVLLPLLEVPTFKVVAPESISQDGD